MIYRPKKNKSRLGWAETLGPPFLYVSPSALTEAVWCIIVTPCLSLPVNQVSGVHWNIFFIMTTVKQVNLEQNGAVFIAE